MTTYLLPTVFAGKLPIEYRIVERKRDMRTRFCRENEKYIIDRDTLNEYIREYNIKVKEDRVIMKDGRQARIFSVLVRQVVRDMTDLIEYMRLCVMNTHGQEQDKCLKILAILEEKENVK